MTKKCKIIKNKNKKYTNPYYTDCYNANPNSKAAQNIATYVSKIAPDLLRTGVMLGESLTAEACEIGVLVAADAWSAAATVAPSES